MVCLAHLTLVQAESLTHDSDGAASWSQPMQARPSASTVQRESTPKYRCWTPGCRCWTPGCRSKPAPSGQGAMYVASCAHHHCWELLHAEFKMLGPAHQQHANALKKTHWTSLMRSRQPDAARFCSHICTSHHDQMGQRKGTVLSMWPQRT